MKKYTGYNAYRCKELFEQNIVSDTNLFICDVDYDPNDTSNNFMLLTEEELDEYNNSDKRNEDSIHLSFLTPYYTEDYLNKIETILDEYQELLEDVESYKASDEQYEDPNLWDISEKLNTYKQEDYHSDIFWSKSI